MSTFRFAIFVFSALLLLTANNRCCHAADSVLVRDIVDRCIGRYRTTDTLLLRCVSTERAVADPAILFRKLHLIPNGMLSQGIASTVVFHRDGRTYVEFDDPWFIAWDRTKERLLADHPEMKADWAAVFEIPYEDVVAAAKVALKESPVSRYRSVFDGARLWQTRSEEKLYLHGDHRLTYSVLDVSALSWRHFAPTVLDFALYSFPIPGLPQDHHDRQQSYLPYLLDGYSADAELLTVAYRGRPCVSIESNDKLSSYLLDPAYEFAVVSGTLRTERGATFATFDVDELLNLGDGVWIPKVISYRRIGVAEEGDGAFSGELLTETTISILEAERNRPEHLMYFSVKVPAGSIVTDETLVDEKSSGDLSASSGMRPAVSYIMPADGSDLDRTILAARRRLAEESSVESRALDKWRWWMVISNAIVVAALCGYLWLRRMRH